MELIATARFKKAMDRAIAADGLHASGSRELVADLADSGLRSQPSAARSSARRSSNAMLLVLTANRGLCGGYNGNVSAGRLASLARAEADGPELSRSKSSGKRGIAGFKFRRHHADAGLHALRRQADVRRSRSRSPTAISDEYITGKLDRLDVVYTKFDQQSPGSTPSSRRCCRWVAGRGRREARARSQRASRCTSSCRRPRAFWKKSCRRASRSSCSSASSTRPSASRSPAWSP